MDGNVTNSSVAIEGLNFCVVAVSGKNRWVKKFFSWDELQVDVKDIVTSKKLPKCEYPDEILDWKKPFFWCWNCFAD